MNLKIWKFWNRNNQHSVAIAETASPTQEVRDASTNTGRVYDFGAYNEVNKIDQRVRLSEQQIDRPISSQNNLPMGMLAEEQLQAFFKNSYFGLGQHNGVHFKSSEYEELGKSSIICQFQNVIEALIEKRMARIAKINHNLIQVEGQSKVLNQQLESLKNEIYREVELLKRQAVLASEKKGWILQALNLYQLGFAKGVREAIDSEVFFK